MTKVIAAADNGTVLNVEETEIIKNENSVDQMKTEDKTIQINEPSTSSGNECSMVSPVFLVLHHIIKSCNSDLMIFLAALLP